MQNSSHQVQYQDRPYQFHLPLPILAHRLVYKDTRDHNHKYYIFFWTKSSLFFLFSIIKPWTPKASNFIFCSGRRWKRMGKCWPKPLLPCHVIFHLQMFIWIKVSGLALCRYYKIHIDFFKFQINRAMDSLLDLICLLKKRLTWKNWKNSQKCLNKNESS